MPPPRLLHQLPGSLLPSVLIPLPTACSPQLAARLHNVPFSSLPRAGGRGETPWKSRGMLAHSFARAAVCPWLPAVPASHEAGTRFLRLEASPVPFPVRLCPAQKFFLWGFLLLSNTFHLWLWPFFAAPARSRPLAPRAEREKEYFCLIRRLLKFLRFISCCGPLPARVATGKGQLLLRPLRVGSSGEVPGAGSVAHQRSSVLCYTSFQSQGEILSLAPSHGIQARVEAPVSDGRAFPRYGCCQE